jgi:diacylglycerol kinase family enzyme
MKAILFHNPKSGTTGGHSAEELTAVLRLAGYDVTYCSTKSRGFKAALKKTYDLAVAAGGDGTVGKILKGIKDRSMPVGIWPLGTANNIATSLGIAGTPHEIAAGWSPKRTRSVTIGMVSGPWGETPFVEAVGWGVMADATDSSIGADAEGHARLTLGRDAFRQALAKAKARNLKVAIDGKPFDGKVLGLEILNIGYAGPGIPLRLAVDPGEAKLDVVAIREEHRDEMLAWLGPAHEDAQAPLSVRRAREIVVHWKGKPQMRIDDAFVEPPEDGKARIVITLQDEPVTIWMPKPVRAKAAKAPAKQAPAKAKTKAAKRKRT